MNVFIPMTGYGSRFVAAGYTDLKPFIKVMGKPIIEWIVKYMYPQDVNIIYVCRQEHLDEYPDMRDKLMDLSPCATIVSIEEWIKKGPVFDVLRAYDALNDADAIDEDEPCIINYCDFFMDWDYAAFAKRAQKRDCDGAVPCYTGFHPHLLPEKNLYASCLTDEEDYLIEIREKYSFEKDKLKAKHSPGTYYFKSGQMMEKYCRILTEHEECAINGEYYASLPYNFMVKDGLKVWIPSDIRYFAQWGTPEDMKEFVYWTDRITASAKENADISGIFTENNSENEVQILIPMAGAGSRFAQAGYKTHKPAIPTTDRKTGADKPMVVCATMDLPGVNGAGSNVIYVDRSFHKTDGVEDAIKESFPNATFITVSELTEGQACTCMLAKDILDKDKPLLIAGCDNGMDIDINRYNDICKQADCVVFTYRHNEAVLANPNAYGWMITDEEGNITDTSIKKAISDTPMEDPAVVATFYFSKASVFIEATNRMIEKNDRINNEFYVDQVAKHVLELGYKAKIFDIDRYVGWGTPKDYEDYQKTYAYFKGFCKRIEEME